MAKYTKVRFLKWFNRPRVFVSIEIDTIGIFFAVGLVLFFASSLTSVLPPAPDFMVSMLIGGFTAFYYSKFKDEAPKGFLKHLLYTMHIYRVKEKEFKEEAKRMDVDVDDYYPNPNEKLFIE